MYSDSKPELVAREFAKMYSLDKNMTETLVSMLKQQLDQALIQEDRSESDLSNN